MTDDKCTVDPNRECDVRQRMTRVETELNVLRTENDKTQALGQEGSMGPDMTAEESTQEGSTGA